MKESCEQAEKRGFVQGAAWAIALVWKYGLGADQLIKEGGFTLKDFTDADVVELDLERIKAAARAGSVWARKRPKNVPAQEAQQ